VNSLSVLARISFGVVFSLAMVPALAAAEGEAHAPKADAHAPAADSHSHGEAGHDAAHGGDAHGHEHAHIGEKDVNKEPQEFRTDLAIFSAIVFGMLAGGLYFTAWPKILGALEAREAGIRNAIADAENAKVQAEAFMKEHKGRLEAVENQVKEILAEARRDAEHTKADIVKSGEAEAETLKNRAIAEINRAKDQALDELFSTLAKQVSQATEQVVGRALTGADQERLIQDALQQFARQKA
jgi:F-type H+-transporting ATPase subunit b